MRKEQLSEGYTDYLQTILQSAEFVDVLTRSANLSLNGDCEVAFRVATDTGSNELVYSEPILGDKYTVPSLIRRAGGYVWQYYHTDHLPFPSSWHIPPELFK